MASSSGANGAPLKKTESYSASKSAMAAIFGPDHKYSKGGSGNEDTSESIASGSGTREEPPSGIKGKGTAEEPYDQGNAPEQIATKSSAAVTNGASGEEPMSGVKGKGTADEPYDQGNAGESTAGSQPITSTVTPPTTNGTTTAASTSTPAPAQKQPDTSKAEETSRGRSLKPPANNDRFERSVSPGTLDDGTHETCSGERGGGYTPSSGLGRLASKLKGK